MRTHVPWLANSTIKFIEKITNAPETIKVTHEHIIAVNNMTDIAAALEYSTHICLIRNVMMVL